MNLFDLFVQRAKKQPDQPLVIAPNKTVSYGEFYQQMLTLKAQLHAHGVQPGDTVGLHYLNSPEYIVLTYAAWGCGASVVPIPVELAEQEKRQIFRNIRIDAVLSHPKMTADIESHQAEDTIPLSEHSVLIPVTKYREHPHQLGATNPAFIRFSSGTTGAAKGVVLSHETIYERIHAANHGLQISSRDRIVWVLSMAYHFAVSIVAYLSFGATIILCRNYFGSTLVQAAVRHRATMIYAAPTHYELMGHTQGTETLPDLRLAIVTTAALRPEIATAFYERFHKPLNETYGIIEVGLPYINLEKPVEKRGSVGRLLPAYEATLKDVGLPNDMRAVYIRGVGLLDAYYEPWQMRSEILQRSDGWFFTGDLGYVDDDDYLYLCGRSKEVISVAGMKFFPQEVEAVLETHPAIRASCVYRYGDGRLDEVPYAEIVINEQYGDKALLEDELKVFCAQHLAIYKIPEKFYVVDDLSRTASGKKIRDASKLSRQMV
ncbi:acyl--CoA ligase [Chloroflexi bacterium TSY]|nr:acyl--CoA ligase [Chloroflexi bacterium TSY]